MKTLNAAAAAHLARECTSLALCWEIEKRDGTFIRGTDHDEDVIILSGDNPGFYAAGNNITGANRKSTADGSIDNTEVTGAIAPTATLGDINVIDIESGVLSGAAVTLLVCDWNAPNDWQIILQYGHLGEIARDSDGMYTTELRGLKQQLSQVFIRTYSTRCQVKRHGDAECKFNLALVTYTGTVTAVTNRKRFDIGTTIGSPQPAPGAFRTGEFTFTSGANAGVLREVKRDDYDDVMGHLGFWEAFPNDVQVGDAFTISEGCDRLFSTCKAKGNQINFRGYGIFVAGLDALTRGPT